MKRKLDSNDAPTVEVASSNSATSQNQKTSTPSFENFGLDPRLLQAVAKSKFAEPTPIQAKAIPPALQGKDVLAKSKTGSGKTAAYVLPILQGILVQKASNAKERTITTLVLVPTIELADQVAKAFCNFSEFCSRDIRVLNLTQRLSDAVLNAKLQDLPDVVVSTPGRASQFVSSGLLLLEKIQSLVIDEADIVLKLDCMDDINNLAKALPKGIQTFLISATLTTEVDQLRNIFCRDPIIVKIDEKEEKGEGVIQYVVKCGEEEKFLLIFVIFKLKLVKGKCIIFVADVDRSYRLKLYLEQYGIKSCVLNGELPINSRLHAIEEFNKGLYDILIAADDQEVIEGVHRKPKQSSEVNDEDDIEAESANEEEEVQEPSSKKPKLDSRSSSNRDFGVSRGIDFENVSCVLNFDLPTTSKSYTHRIGRTARAGKSGMALSFAVPRSEHGKHKPTTHASTRNNEKVLAKIIERQAKKGQEVKPYNFDMSQVSAFRYRMNDALRAVTRVAVHEARAREIKQELLRSEKLRKHFEDNPEDMRHLQRRSDGGALGGGGVVRVQGHLKHVPDYLLPGGQAQGKGQKDVGEVGFLKINGDSSNKKRKTKKGAGFRKGGRKPGGGGSGRNDPLKSFKSGRK